mgnify:CR=1 FL=1|tara:strand:- start:31 stop:192 length:162 start_codon:yes stop_codon:yes gene_type:complete
MSGEMLWYEGEGIYQDGDYIASLDTNEMIDLLIQHGYIVIRSEKKESKDGSSK